MKKIYELKITWWAYILSFIPSNLLGATGAVWFVKYGHRIRFYDEPWTKSSKMGKQADIYARECSIILLAITKKEQATLKKAVGLK